ncbi:uncharacterized protein CLUP02_02898 [Colletotrichum lupini]|uniref:Uncharacterized protein n=1 Tax=Colletotrichum lupini TaxID=145971 RepID=A0A9Q8SHU3_9PEZI|nr:uncharacterized protein CLUP02_02898 [Colletotrichum lupini]UQC77430.1 hypothetical protein CLUP02_02898 [Colletotrichum lupini]
MVVMTQRRGHGVHPFLAPPEIALSKGLYPYPWQTSSKRCVLLASSTAKKRLSISQLPKMLTHAPVVPMAAMHIPKCGAMAVATGWQTVSVITIPEHRYDQSCDTRIEMKIRCERGVESWKPEINVQEHRAPSLFAYWGFLEGGREEAMPARDPKQPQYFAHVASPLANILSVCEASNCCNGLPQTSGNGGSDWFAITNCEWQRAIKSYLKIYIIGFYSGHDLLMLTMVFRETKCLGKRKQQMIDFVYRTLITNFLKDIGNLRPEGFAATWPDQPTAVMPRCRVVEEIKAPEPADVRHIVEEPSTQGDFPSIMLPNVLNWRK